MSKKYILTEKKYGDTVIETSYSMQEGGEVTISFIKKNYDIEYE